MLDDFEAEFLKTETSPGIAIPEPGMPTGFVDMSAAQWRVVATLAHAHADRFRRSAVALEQSQGNGMAVRMTLHYEEAEHAHAAFMVESGGSYRTVEP